jgi:hypothetical protein
MKILVFGDSFSRTFTLFNDSNIKVTTYSGGSAKGLTKLDNKNRLNIIDKVKSNKLAKCIIFLFGNVDLHFSYYYTLIKNQPFNIKTIIEEYVNFVESIPTSNGVTKYIFSIYPSPVKTENVYYQLQKYGILEIEESKKYADLIIEHSDDKLRLNRLREANNFLKIECKKRNIIFIDLNKYLLKNNKLKPEFYDLSILNIHIRYEPQLEFIVKEIKKCKIKNKNNPVIEKKYLEYKKNRLYITKKLKISKLNLKIKKNNTKKNTTKKNTTI